MIDRLPKVDPVDAGMCGVDCSYLNSNHGCDKYGVGHARGAVNKYPRHQSCKNEYGETHYEILLYELRSAVFALTDKFEADVADLKRELGDLWVKSHSHDS